MITSFQLRAARALLNMSRIELGEKVDIHARTIQKIENSETLIKNTQTNTLVKLEEFFLSKGVELTPPLKNHKAKGAKIEYFGDDDIE